MMDALGSVERKYSEAIDTLYADPREVRGEEGVEEADFETNDFLAASRRAQERMGIRQVDASLTLEQIEGSTEHRIPERTGIDQE